MRLFSFKFSKLKLFVSIVLFIIFSISSFVVIDATNCPETDYDCQIAEIQREIDALSPAQEYNKKELSDLKDQIKSLTLRISGISIALEENAVDISRREEDLSFASEIFQEKTKNHYKFVRLYDPIIPFLSSENASNYLREVSFRAKAANEDIKTMESYAKDLLQLENDKKDLETNQKNLSSLKSQLADRAEFLEGEVAKTDKYLSELSAKQEEIIALKAGSFITSVGDVELADDYKASIKGFRESAPAGTFAVFSFGAYTHRKGMSQYGARGRAENGQDYRQILKAYYGKDPVNVDTSGTISVSGYGALDFETYYLYGISEMPSTWHKEALKAQAIAARTFAYRYKTQGSTICTSESCQVFRSSKASSPPEAWRQAVDETRGQILTDVTTFYSSTAGGYLPAMGWDTTDGNGGGNFIDKAWEGKGGSPWLYKSWYRQGYTASGATCGKGDPWLTNEELADIINAALVLRNRNDDRITPITTSCAGGNPYTHQELVNEASALGGINSISSVSVLQGNGNTNSVVVNGTITLSWSEFKRAYNLRAPGYLRIPQGTGFGSSSDFAFFNIEKK